ncbi:hypothetical protein, partial [Paenibacillus dendritiformis]|uniref:hypothetical protein n=1 Tax=Paenibacillus dendritiformis TaxID=130049 RepID=UPI001BCBD4C6
LNIIVIKSPGTMPGLFLYPQLPHKNDAKPCYSMPNHAYLKIPKTRTTTTFLQNVLIVAYQL